jgi:hypothetical protein
MPIIELQKRARELGRIRIGEVVPTQNGKTRPSKLDRFRFTSADKVLLDKVAELYGGEVREWTPQGNGAKAWEVVSDSTRIPILVPPQPVTQWMELWSGGGCVRRCDGVQEIKSQDNPIPCICKANEREDCKPTTRLNVVLRDVEGIGVWRLESKGWNAAVELPDTAAFLSQVGGYIDGFLGLEARVSIDAGKTRHFMVPVIHVAVTPAELMAGKGRIQPASIEGPVERQAIESGSSGFPPGHYVELARAAVELDAVRQIWQVASKYGVPQSELDEIVAIGNQLQQPGAVEGEVVDAEPADNPVAPTADTSGLDIDVLWQQVLAAGGALEMSLDDLEQDFAFKNQGLSPSSAKAEDFVVYLADLKARAAA